MTTKKWAGARWFIGGKTKTTALASETSWVEIEEGRTASGNMGLEWQTTDATTYKSKRRSAKTVADAGQIEIGLLRQIADPGQAALKAACADPSDDCYNFKVELDDNPDPSPGDGTPTSIRLSAQVHALVNRAGSPTNLFEAMARLDIEDVLEFDAAA